MATDPSPSFSAESEPASGGPQTADGSTGVAQIGGAGSQTATNALGAVQVAQPGTEVEGSVQGPLRPDMPDGAVPEADAGASVEPAESGPQTADGSAGTVQVGGGSQTASDSVGSAQIAVPAVESDAGAGGLPTSSPDASAQVTPSGGTQSAEGSTGTLQVGGSPQGATASTGTAQVGVAPVGGTVGGDGSPRGTFFSADETPAPGGTPVSTPATSESGLPAGAQPLGAELNTVPLGAAEDQPLASVARLGTLPFTGLELWFVVLLAFTLLGWGYVLRRSARTA